MFLKDLTDANFAFLDYIKSDIESGIKPTTINKQQLGSRIKTGLGRLKNSVVRGTGNYIRDTKLNNKQKKKLDFYKYVLSPTDNK